MSKVRLQAKGKGLYAVKDVDPRGAPSPEHVRRRYDETTNSMVKEKMREVFKEALSKTEKANCTQT